MGTRMTLKLWITTERADTMKREVPLAHPGIILLEDWLTPMGISQYALAKGISVPPRRINEIVKGLRGITVDTALRLGAFFGTDGQSWVNLQTNYDTEQARETMAEVLSRISRHQAAEA
jgi:addiction module HigA family antidote